MNPKARFNAAYLIFAFFLVLLFHEGWVQYTQVAHIPYSDFQKLLNENKIAEVIINDHQIVGTLKEPEANQKKQFATNRVEQDIALLLDSHGVKYSRVLENNLVKEVLSWVLPVFVFFGLWLLLAKRMG
ncbi:cell division protein FtsH, partial [bacterium]|nr:cell division protein FtsH [bacterium]